LSIGLLGGAFNPPHIGHLICAQEACIQLGLEAVFFVPVSEPPHRMINADPGAELRYEMVKAATSDDERFEVSRAELERPGASYTVDTLRDFKDRYPNDSLFFILGADQARQLASWHEPETVLDLCTVAVCEREQVSREVIGACLHQLRGADRMEFFDMPQISVSSSLIRTRIKRGASIRYLVPEKVAEIIGKRELYRMPAQSVR
jgi:nicotinate-nucleotide adenylyltransferase